MKPTLFAILSLFSLGLTVSACSVATIDDTAVNESTDDQDLEVSTNQYAYVTIRHDQRKCMAPMCGGYWIRDVNTRVAERYVSGLDFAKAKLDPSIVQVVLDAPDSEVVLYGKLGPQESQFGTRPLLVKRAYRGMPGVKAKSGDTFYRAEDRNPQIQCFTAPCPNEMAFKLNSSARMAFDGYEVKAASKPHVDQNWLVDRINHHDALVAAKFVNGPTFPGGKAKILDASQVYLNVADMAGPCPVFKLAACPEGSVWTFTRNEALCQHPNGCVADNGNCPSLAQPHCAEGYEVSAWRVDSDSCMKFACDPAFVWVRE